MHKVAIIGAGPAGIAAAVQLQRFGISPLIFEQTRIGGLLNNAFLVENYPGFPKGISGVNLVKKFKQHLEEWGIDVVKERVIKVIENKNNLILQTKKNYRAQILIIASGTKPKIPEIDIKSKATQGNLGQLKVCLKNKIFFEVYPIKNIKNKRVLIVGAGDAAFDYALNLSRRNKVIILNRNKKIKGLDILFKQIKKCHNITYMQKTKLSEITQLHNQLITKLLNKSKEISLFCDYIIFTIGREPAIDFLSSSIRRKFPEGDNQRIYFVGDVKQGNLRQTAIAVGDGIQAAMKITQRLKIGS